MFDDIFSDGILKKYIKETLKDPWENTNFEGYVYLNPPQKGKFGEKFVEEYMKKKGHIVEKRKSKGHDRIIDDYKTEIKFGLCTQHTKDSFIINHISKEKDWERLIFFGINPKEEDCRLLWFTRQDFISCITEGTDIFSCQQGGKDIDNDDYMCCEVNRLVQFPFVRNITEWKRKPNLIDFYND
jgi:hypothetical protein